MSSVAAEVRAGIYIDGIWSTGGGTDTRDVRSPYNGELLATVPDATRADVREAVAAAQRAMHERPLSPSERYSILSRTAELVRERAEQFARLIVSESGKPIRDARAEVTRAVQTITLCAEEAKRLGGEVVPFDATPGSEHRVGFTLSQPIGVVCAITPFNAPLNQMNHKVPTAVAAGCTVVLKPAEQTPLSAIELIGTMAEAGLPAGHVNLVLGAGPTVGQWLLEDERFAAYSFTGSVAVGRHIRRTVGLRKTVLELGNNSANVVHADADLELASAAIVKSAYAYAGQLCISAQRILVHEAVLEDFLDLFLARVHKLRVGDPALEETDLGPMIDERAAERAEQLIRRSVEGGARLLVGGERQGRFVTPAVLTNVDPAMEIACEEAFAPVVAVLPYSTPEQAVALANGTRFGLQSSVFTESIDVAFFLARGIEVGSVMVNEGSHFRIDQMPFGGVKDSGTGREGVKYAVAEFTEPRLVALTLKAPR